MIQSIASWSVSVVVLVLGHAAGDPVGYREVSRPLSVVSDIGQHLAARAPLLQTASTSAGVAGGDPRLPLPSAQDLEAIKKVAQILVMLGEQVIPAIISDGPQQPQRPAFCDSTPAEDVPNDPVGNN